MIKEAYCSPELSKLFKEKGFNEPCFSFYQWYESKVTLFKGFLPEYSASCCRHNNKSCDIMSRPTHQMAMAYVRKKGFHIEIEAYPHEDGCFYWHYRVMEMVKYNGVFGYFKRMQKAGFDSYEETIEAALKDCLKFFPKR